MVGRLIVGDGEKNAEGTVAPCFGYFTTHPRDPSTPNISPYPPVLYEGAWWVARMRPPYLQLKRGGRTRRNLAAQVSIYKGMI